MPDIFNAWRDSYEWGTEIAVDRRATMAKKETSTGEFIDVLPVGTKVRHKKHRNLTGIIVRHEYHEGGKISPLPYCVHWDQQEAYKVLGWFAVYPMRTEIKAIYYP